MEKVILEEFPQYSITRCGLLFDNIKNIRRTWSLNEDGYYVIVINDKEGNRTCRRRARLLAQTFIPNPENKPYVNHIDHNRINDSLENLEWVTAKENSQKSLEFHPDKWKITNVIDYPMAHNICRMIQEGSSNTEITDELNVTVDTVKHIRRGKTWTDVSKHYTLKKSYRGINEDVVIEICNLINEGANNKNIVDTLEDKGVTIHIVKKIRSKSSHKNITEKLLK